MRATFIGALLDLPSMAPRDRRAAWRQSLTVLAQSRANDGPSPLDAISPDALQAAVRAALEADLVEDLDWLAPAAAGAALYELASALQPSVEQRELGRRVLARLLAGDAETFVSIATRMALGAGKGLFTPGVRARLALTLEQPLSRAIPDGPLALALVSRRQLMRETVLIPATASLASRRLASRLLERAAREASRLAQQGDDHAIRVFASDAADGAARAFEQLLSDRESLVWKHVAVARGLLSPWIPAWRKAINDGIDPKLSPTEWRRAATSIVAMTAVAKNDAERLFRAALTNILDRDRGAAGAMVWGLARAADAEPEEAATMLAEVVRRAPAEVAEALCELGSDIGATSFVERAAHTVKQALVAAQGVDARDDAAVALRREIVRDLEILGVARASKPDSDAMTDAKPVRVLVTEAMDQLAESGAQAAYAKAKLALEAAQGAVQSLEAVGEEEASADAGGTMARRTSLALLRDLDLAWLESNVLSDLLKLAPNATDARANEVALDSLHERLAEWILAREGSTSGTTQLPHPTLHLRRLRALIHLADGEATSEDAGRAARLRKRWSRMSSALLERFSQEMPQAIRRTISAALARALDALVRAEAIDPADALLCVARVVTDGGEFRVLAEASMDPDLRHAFSRYSAFLAQLSPPHDPDAEVPSISLVDLIGPKLKALEAWANDIVLDPSSRAEALRNVLSRLHQSLKAIMQARSLASLTTATNGTTADVIAAFETNVQALAQIAAGSRARLDGSTPHETTQGESIALLVSRVLAGTADRIDDADFTNKVAELTRELPKPLARTIADCLVIVPSLPRNAEGERESRRTKEPLPDWIPPRRTLGGFYILRPLGAGGAGSVFVVNRAEERSDANAEKFALKVPDFSATAARTLSEQEFLQMFRAEASALIGLPTHPNLARFVTFDTAARPKPILVMELVEGTNLEDAISLKTMTTKRAFQIVDDVLAGLEIMHAQGIGHLDLKPSNILLRGGKEAVLVDFGLAGRHLRPGCGSGPYAPGEVWGAPMDGTSPTPAKADIYSLGCVTYEALTGTVLFYAEQEIQQITMHLVHDGFPDRLRKLSQIAELQPLAELIFSMLRRDPANRPTATALRAEVRRIAAPLSKMRWPLDS